MRGFAVAAATLLAAARSSGVRATAPYCPLRNSTTVAYSLADGVGLASQVWVEDLLWWWASHEPAVRYQALSGAEVAACALGDAAAFPHLRVFVNPGGDAYAQLTSLGAAGRANVLAFVERDDARTACVLFADDIFPPPKRDIRCFPSAQATSSTGRSSVNYSREVMHLYHPRQVCRLVRGRIHGRA